MGRHNTIKSKSHSCRSRPVPKEKARISGPFPFHGLDSHTILRLDRLLPKGFGLEVVILSPGGAWQAADLGLRREGRAEPDQRGFTSVAFNIPDLMR